MVEFSNQRLNFLIGIVIILVFIGFIYWFNSRASVSHVDNNQRIFFAKFSNIGDLDIGSPVTIGGVNIGKVTQRTFLPKEKMILIKMNVNAIPLPSDSMAKIATYGLFGDNYILIIPGGMDGNLQNNATFDFTQSAVSFDLVIRELGSKIKNSNKKIKK